LRLLFGQVRSPLILALIAAGALALAMQSLYLLACRSLPRAQPRARPLEQPRGVRQHRHRARLQALFVYVPFMHLVFGSAGLTGVQLAWCAAAAVLVLPEAGLEERRRARRAPARPRTDP
jgi:hypothetical protein